ncbi:hypothetical protein UlMin_001410 [Ulmus minor]
MGSDDFFSNTDLGLCLGSDHTTLQPDHHLQQQKKILSLKYDDVLPSLTLGPSDCRGSAAKTVVYFESSADDLPLLQASSSFSNSSSNLKTDRDSNGGEEEELEERVCSRVSVEEDEDGSRRKKLKLTKEQSAVLEDSFKQHSVLNPKQKQDLARQLNLQSRQVEVWFQNRRARTKLKQTEAEYEAMKKCCETLREENKRLQMELQELKSLKLTTPFFM